MGTLVDIPDDLMHELLKETEARTKKDAIISAITTYLDPRRRDRLASLIGNYDFGYTAQDLDRTRADRF